MLILASASAIRAKLLREAGVAFGVRPPSLDESAVKSTLHAQGVALEDFAGALAEAKALDVSGAVPGALVLGCDQTLLCDDRLFDKPRDLAEARENLLFLRGKTHQLICGAVLAQNGRPVWHHVTRATLHVRDFSEAFLEAYLKSEGSEILSSVGCYRLEGRGSQLFDAVDGDFFTVLGLPLIALLSALRERAIVPA
ncbi:septum formation protein [Rhizomicrobium palustre]|jgi:septum formation protein|uniref:Nucleoside triphosphate pyrophosphatase n=1 Tax=Rhizomicrobium palustre TaxID=189966 RepID=A0A846MX90_9PROT|nr:Maf family protein [Rhizomicrobium palustre]NIK88178.1 septum formation protein [Rhizomicrobium palustre]